MDKLNQHGGGNGSSATICPMHPIETDHLENIYKCDRCYEVNFVRYQFSKEKRCFICNNKSKKISSFCSDEHRDLFIETSKAFPSIVMTKDLLN